MFLCALVTVPFILVWAEDKENIGGKWGSLCQHIEELCFGQAGGPDRIEYFTFFKYLKGSKKMHFQNMRWSPRLQKEYA
jgi:hypothetical protein